MIIIIYNHEKILSHGSLRLHNYLISGSHELLAAAHNSSNPGRSELLMSLSCPPHPISLERRSHFMRKNYAVCRPSNLVMQGLWMAVFYWLMFSVRLSAAAAVGALRRCHGYKSALTENLYQRQEQQSSQRTVLSQAAELRCCMLLFITRRHTYTCAYTLVRRNALTHTSVRLPQLPPTPATVKSSWGRYLVACGAIYFMWRSAFCEYWRWSMADEF